MHAASNRMTAWPIPRPDPDLKSDQCIYYKSERSARAP